MSPRILALGLLAAAGCLPPVAWENAEVESAPSALDADRGRSMPVAVAYDAPEPGGGGQPETLQVPASPRKDRDPIFFRLGAGYGALGQLDLEPCRDRGLPRGYVRVHVTFRADGRVARAALQSDTAPPEEALTCIGERLELAVVPPFEGGDVTLSKTLFVD